MGGLKSKFGVTEIAAELLMISLFRITIRAVPPTSPSRPEAGQRFREGTRVFLIRAVADAKDARHLICYVDEETAT